ncbi:hypothetical protein [Spirosoma flavum]|uniref:Transcriptional regulator n=1 Tax=Spirosoma flavum TaxID=2048557 RepID=A0ABW6AR31_9BACT
MENELKENIEDVLIENVPSLMTKVVGLLSKEGNKVESELAIAFTKIIQYRTRTTPYTEIEGGKFVAQEEYFKSIDIIYNYIKTELR